MTAICRDSADFPAPSDPVSISRSPVSSSPGITHVGSSSSPAINSASDSAVASPDPASLIPVSRFTVSAASRSGASPGDRARC